MDVQKQLRQAIKHFWLTRESQGVAQAEKPGLKDAGSRSKVTGGKQMDGFIELLSDVMAEEGLSPDYLHVNRATTIPGFYRATKNWDLVIVLNGTLVASLELKSHVGSFGNNVNNRIEEALGNATDLNTAFREGAFAPSSKPWLGYLMLVQDTQQSARPINRIDEPHFTIFPEFKGASYQKKYELFCTRLVRERLYDSACLLCSPDRAVDTGEYSEPSREISFSNFLVSLRSRIGAVVREQNLAHRNGAAVVYGPHDKPRKM